MGDKKKKKKKKTTTTTTRTMRVLMVVLVLSFTTGCFNGLNPATSEPLSEDWSGKAIEEREQAAERKQEDWAEEVAEAMKEADD